MLERLKIRVYDIPVETEDGEPLTTVGYGDVYPITPLGKLLGGFTAFLGIGMFALPTGILASGFAEEIKRRHEKERICPPCPHCGGDVSSIINKN